MSSLHLIVAAGAARVLIDSTEVIAVRLSAADAALAEAAPLLDLTARVGMTDWETDSAPPNGVVIACGRRGQVSVRIAATRVEGAMHLGETELAPLPPISDAAAGLFDAVTRGMIGESHLLRLIPDASRLARIAE